MSEENQNINSNLDHGSVTDQNSQDVTNQSTYSKEDHSQYSFWSEQAAGRSTNPYEQQGAYNTANGMNDNLYGQGTYGEQQNYGNFAGQQNYAGFYNYTNAQGPQKKQRRKGSGKFRKVAKIVFGAALAGTIAAACFTGVLVLYNRFNGNSKDFTLSVGSEVDPIPSTTVLDTAIIPESDVSKVYEKTLPSIVAIESTMSQTYEWFGQTYQDENPGSGSGIIVGETDKELLIATNNHVVEGASKIEIVFIDGTRIEGITKGTDKSADLAIVSIDITTINKDTLNKIKVASLGDSDKVKEGEMAIAIGNALGYGQSMTVGYISALNRTVTFQDGNKMELLQTDAAINPGNSGGALMNAKGEVIGINSAKLAASSIEGMGYAIPISYAYPILEELMSREIIKEEDQGYLGVSCKEITEERANYYGMPLGVYVYEFLEGSPAKAAGIQQRDIITAIDGVEVTTTTSLREKVFSYKYGTTVKITVQRSVNGEYKEMVFDVKLGRKADFEAAEKSNSQPQQQEYSQPEEAPDEGATVIPQFPFDFFK